MKRILASFAALAIAACSAPEGAQEELPDSVPEEVSEESLRAWNVRLDDPAADDAGGVQIIVEDANLRATTGASGLAWRPADQVLGGDFELSAAFSAGRGDPDGGAAGLFVGGRNLRDPDHAYTAFLVSPGGEYRIFRREGDGEQSLVDWRALPAAGSDEPRTLAVQVEGEEVRFLIDGQTVETLPRAEVEPHGSAGIRLEDGAEVDVREWSLSSPADASASGNPS